MEDLDVALKTAGFGIAAVFTLMASISFGIWLMGRAFVLFERRAERRREEPRVAAAPAGRRLQRSAS